ncbi:MAG: chemotaxis protein CheW [Pseudomonadota bacterium]
MQNELNEVYSLVLPTLTDSLLLPNVTVAEIVPYIDVEKPAAGQPAWYLGELNWRGSRAPMASLEIISGDEERIEPTRRSRVAVLHTLSGNKDVPFIGLLVQGIPRLAHVLRSEFHLIDDHGNDPDSAIKCKVRFAGQKILIPNLDKLEEMIASIPRNSIAR